MQFCAKDSTADGWSSGCFFFFQAEDGIRDYKVTGVQTCALPICRRMKTVLWLVAVATILTFVGGVGFVAAQIAHAETARVVFMAVLVAAAGITMLDRKSTRLNSSHLVISYAVFCLKKKILTYHSHFSIFYRPIRISQAIFRFRLC